MSICPTSLTLDRVRVFMNLAPIETHKNLTSFHSGGMVFDIQLYNEVAIRSDTFANIIKSNDLHITAYPLVRLLDILICKWRNRTAGYFYHRSVRSWGGKLDFVRVFSQNFFLQDFSTFFSFGLHGHASSGSFYDIPDWRHSGQRSLRLDVNDCEVSLFCFCRRQDGKSISLIYGSRCERLCQCDCWIKCT